MSHEQSGKKNVQVAVSPVIESEHSLLTDTLASVEDIADQKKEPKRFTRRAFWKDRTFRFNLRSFRLGGDLSLRRFSIVEASLLLICALLASRGLGVVRQSIFNAIFGTGPEANAYYAAARLPDTLFELITGGALTHAFIPVFVAYEKSRSRKEVWQLVSLVFNVMLVVMTFFLLITEWFAPTIVSSIIVPGYSPSEQILTVSLTRIILFQPLILGLGTIATAILNSKRQFLLSALSIAIYNIGLIGGLLVTLAVPRVGIYGPTYGILAAAFLQTIVMFPGLWKQGAHYYFHWNLSDPGLHEVMRLLIPNALAVVVGSIGPILDTAFISYLPDNSSLAAIHNAQLLYAVPVALIAQAVGQSLLPHLATQATNKNYVRMRLTTLKVMGASILLSLPVTLMLWLLGKPIIHLIFQHGAFKAHSSLLTYLTLTGYAIGLPGIIAGQLFANGFIALKDTRTPLFTGILALAIRYGLMLLLLHSLLGVRLILAIPLATAISATLEALLLCLLLLLRLRKHVKTDEGMARLRRRRHYQREMAIRIGENSL